jgi:3-oxoacyl-[acyl-carrier-protein] synthase-1
MVAPSGEGAVRCMRQAIATIGARKVGYINTHGTSTPIGDQKEVGAIREVFGAEPPKFSSTKSLTGHSLGATGVQEAIYCLLMLQGDYIAASANVENLDPEFAGAPIVTGRLDNAGLDTVISNSFGFGGTNCTLALSRYHG